MSLFGLTDPDNNADVHFAPMERLTASFGERRAAAQDLAYLTGTGRSTATVATEVREEIVQALAGLLQHFLDRERGDPGNTERHVGLAVHLYDFRQRF